MSLCWSSQGFSALHYRLCFLQCDWRRQISLQKVTNVNEVQEIGWMSPDLSLVPKLFLIEERGNEPGDEANQTLSCRWVWPQDYNPLAYCQHLTRYGSLIPFYGFFQRLEFKRTWKAQWYRLQSSDLSLLGLLQALCICYTTIINSPKLLTIVFTRPSALTLAIWYCHMEITSNHAVRVYYQGQCKRYSQYGWYGFGHNHFSLQPCLYPTSSWMSAPYTIYLYMLQDTYAYAATYVEV